jgi:hypothetical protein
VFVIRLWLEEKDENEGALWRGHITHVMTGKRSYLHGLEGIASFIKPYLQTMSTGGDDG